MAHSPDSLVRMSSHLAYEVEMLAGTAAYLRDEAAADDLPTVRNAMSESFALHARTICAFLTDKPEGKEVAARSYVKGWKAKLPKEHVRRLPKARQLTVLTTRRERLPEIDATWRDDVLLASLAAELSRFVEAVPDELVAPDVKARVHAALAGEDAEIVPVTVQEERGFAPDLVAAAQQVVGEVEAEPEPVAVIEAEPEAEPEPVAVIEAEPEVEPVPEVEPEVEPENGHVAFTDPEPVEEVPSFAAEVAPKPLEEVVAEPEPEPAAEAHAAPEPDPFPDPSVTPVVPGLHRDEFGAIVFRPRRTP